MEDIYGVVVTYYPGEKLKENIASYLAGVKKLLIIDNTPSRAQIVHRLADDEKVEVYHDGKNRGIAERLNFAARKAKEEGYRWMLTMDQDSSFSGIDQYLSCFQQFESKHRVSVFGVRYYGTSKKSGCEFSDEQQLITSGSIVNLDVLFQLEEFDENLFIDEVDFEYCYRSLINGFKVVKFNNIVLNHEIGESGQYRSLKNLKETKRALHSPVRLYYMVRNHLYVKKKYEANFKNVFKKRRADIMVAIKNNILYNRQRLTVIKYLYKGVSHYYKDVMGKLNSNEIE